jgi:hypothetical protein
MLSCNILHFVVDSACAVCTVVEVPLSSATPVACVEVEPVTLLEIAKIVNKTKK